MHNKLQAKLLLNSTLENLDNYKLSPVPDNYRLWFEYAAGSIDQLNNDIDTMIIQQKAINEAVCQKLFIQHIASHDQRDIDDTRIAIGDMLNVMVGHLKEWDSSSNQFSDKLNECIRKLDNNPSIGEVKEIVTTVTDQARQAHNVNSNIQTTLHNLSDEISTLRQDVNRLGNDALTDSLTQIINRRGYDVALKNATEKATEEGSSCALVVLDIDDFKRINDTFGHQIGDKILKFIASTLGKNVRGNDILARYGGEEFAIILPDTNFEGAMRVAENLRKAVVARQLTTGSNGKVIGRITASFGVSCFRHGEDLDDFFDRVDKLMYTAKQQGKDQVIGDR
ncbi:MAG: GGDEF domain-containing protein [Oceanicoccus sp.]|uniref:GGDEF domain-containing protein n=1 Tax=Oceanicoccus sp. TaxID=2691044 RepID=UPI00260D77CC|nr:GGDEF domain-containing protein [Oceanicoccus sp.]MDG1772293.1 GGDEF domain-containing protein [Oceanicoccus sp.]